MNYYLTKSFGLWFGLAFTLPLAAQFEASAVIQYTAEEIVLGFEPRAMNNRGWIVGATTYPRPMRYRPGVGTEQISERLGWLSDINDAGTAVGALSIDGNTKAIVRPAGASWAQLGTLGGDTSVAWAINESEQIVGWSLTATRAQRPFIYTTARGMRTLFSGPTGVAASINEMGQACGWLLGGGSFLWDPSTGMINIGEAAGTDRRFAGYQIADNGTVPGKLGRDFAIFSVANGLRGVGTLTGSTGLAGVSAVNGRGWTVGSDPNYANLNARAFLYVYGQGMRDLNSLVTTPLAQPLVHAVDINDRDEILAFADGSPRRYYILRRVRE